MPKKNEQARVRLTPMMSMALILWLIVAVALWKFLPSIAPQEIGGLSLLGDAFGAVSVLVSAFAFIALYVSIKLQSDELKLQREELEQTRTELRGQTKQFALQNETLRKQVFETSFFQLLALLSDIVNAYRKRQANASDLEGRACLEHWYEEAKRRYNSRRDTDYKADSDMDCYIRVFSELKLEPYLGVYFRMVYNILKFVDRSDVVDKQYYGHLLRAQLSTYELLFLLYNCQDPRWTDKFGPLAGRYSLFEDMDTSRLIDQSHKEWINARTP